MNFAGHSSDKICAMLAPLDSEQLKDLWFDLLDVFIGACSKWGKTQIREGRFHDYTAKLDSVVVPRSIEDFEMKSIDAFKYHDDIHDDNFRRAWYDLWYQFYCILPVDNHVSWKVMLRLSKTEHRCIEIAVGKVVDGKGFEELQDLWCRGHSSAMWHDFCDDVIDVVMKKVEASLVSLNRRLTMRRAEAADDEAADEATEVNDEEGQATKKTKRA
jgi:hypothetical protein